MENHGQPPFQKGVNVHHGVVVNIELLHIRVEFDPPEPQPYEALDLVSRVFHVPVEGTEADKFRVFPADRADITVDVLHLGRGCGGGKDDKLIDAPPLPPIQKVLDGPGTDHGDLVKTPNINHRPDGDFVRIDMGVAVNNHNIISISKEKPGIQRGHFKTNRVLKLAPRSGPFPAIFGEFGVAGDFCL
jgi:hypothetical protein